MITMKELGIIIPMHEFGKENIELVNKAIESVPEGILICLSTPKGTTPANVKGLSDRAALVVSTEEGTTFADLVNSGVNAFSNNPDVKWFSILEFDDEYTPAWFKTAEKYINEKPDLSVILPIAELVTTEGRALSFANELTWATSFNDSEKLGTVDEEGLKIFMDFNVTGGIIKTEDFNDPSLKDQFYQDNDLHTMYVGEILQVYAR